MESTLRYQWRFAASQPPALAIKCVLVTKLQITAVCRGPPSAEELELAAASSLTPSPRAELQLKDLALNFHGLDLALTSWIGFDSHGSELQCNRQVLLLLVKEGHVHMPSRRRGAGTRCMSFSASSS